MRMSPTMIDEASSVLKGAVGKPRASLLLHGEGTSELAGERLRRQLTDAGFAVTELAIPSGTAARTLQAASDLMEGFASSDITADDLVVALGDADTLSLASYACSQWCAGVPLAMVPTGQMGLVEASLTPRGINVGARESVLSLRTATKHVLFDTSLAVHEATDEDALMARVLMVVTAMCDSEAAFSRLWDRTEDICAGDLFALCEQLQDTVKLRGKILSSTALALRQSLAYGEAFARALTRLVDGLAPSTARAEALRFQARLAAGEGLFEVDDVLAQDELLDALELPLVSANVNAQELIRAVREERFARSNRFLLGLPRKLGRVRLAAVTDERIAEHVEAWCASRAV